MFHGYWRSILVILVGLVPMLVSGQGKFTVNGRMKIEGGDLSNTRAVEYKNGVKERTISANLSKFSLDLDIGNNYVISFEKDGYVAKKISFNTNAPAEAAANGFTPFDFAVSLFKQYDDVNIVVFNQPVGMIRYDDKTGDQVWSFRVGAGCNAAPITYRVGGQQYVAVACGGHEVLDPEGGDTILAFALVP